MALPHLFADPGFAVVSAAAARAPVPARGPLPVEVAEAARRWETHVIEVLRGVRVEAPGGAQPRAEYDPATTSLRQRQVAKIAELVPSATEG